MIRMERSIQYFKFTNISGTDVERPDKQPDRKTERGPTDSHMLADLSTNRKLTSVTVTIKQVLYYTTSFI